MDPEPLLVRPSIPADFDSLYGMYCEVIADGGGTPAGGGPSEETFARGWLEGRAVFVVELAGDRVGSFFIRSNFPAFAAHIAQSGYIVARRARRRGVGRALVLESLSQAKEMGYSAMMFNLVFETNPSRQLYESVGFTIIGRIPNARRDEAAFIYWRQL